MRILPEPADRHRPWRDALWVAGVPLALLALALVLVPPQGNFPFNDDWIYGRAVSQWLAAGHFEGHPFSTASLIGQAAWGTLFCLIFGFSFEVLRWSTIVLWALAAATTGLTARAIGAQRWSAMLAGTLVIANPLAFNLGYTFMTDVPFMAMMAVSGYGYVRALETPRSRWCLLGSLFGAGALLIRQFAPVILIAFLLVSIPRWRSWRTPKIRRCAVALGAPWLIAFTLLNLMPQHAGALGHVWKPRNLGNGLMEQLLGAPEFYGITFVYLALFALPLVLGAAACWLAPHVGCWKRRLLWTAPILTMLVIFTAARAPHRMPYLGNIIYDLGLGPMTMRGNYSEDGMWTPHAWGNGWWLLTAAGLLGAAWMGAAILVWLKGKPNENREPAMAVRRRQQTFLGIWAIIAILALYHPWLPVRFDRYLLGALVPVLALVASAPILTKPVICWAQGICLALQFSFSLAAQHDYLSWNQVRWKALGELMAEGIRPEKIDGGYEFNGWYTSDHFIERLGPMAFLKSGPKGWWVVDDVYAIAWKPREGYVTRDVLPYATWLGPDQELLLLERESQ